MREVELRRHTDNDGDELSEEGVREAERIGREQARPPYAVFASTGAARATRMAEIVREQVGQDEVPVREEPGLRSQVEDRWREAAKAAGKGSDVAAMRTVDEDLVEQEARLLGSALRDVVARVPEGGRAFVVGHSPTNEAAVLGLTGTVVAPLGKGAGVLVTEEAGEYTARPLD